MSTFACKIHEIANSRLKSTVEGPSKCVCVCVYGWVCGCFFSRWVCIYIRLRASFFSISFYLLSSRIKNTHTHTQTHTNSGISGFGLGGGGGGGRWGPGGKAPWTLKAFSIYEIINQASIRFRFWPKNPFML